MWMRLSGFWFVFFPASTLPLFVAWPVFWCLCVSVSCGAWHFFLALFILFLFCFFCFVLVDIPALFSIFAGLGLFADFQITTGESHQETNLAVHWCACQSFHFLLWEPLALQMSLKKLGVSNGVIFSNCVIQRIFCFIHRWSDPYEHEACFEVLE